MTRETFLWTVEFQLIKVMKKQLPWELIHTVTMTDA